MIVKKRFLLLLLAFVIVLESCEQDNPVIEVNSLAKIDFDPAILKSLASYNLSPADFDIDNKDITASQARNSQIAPKTITIGGEEIAYFETSGKGPDIFMVHGNSQSSNSFSRQLNSELGEIFHIISIDLSGHGFSQRSPNPAITYQLPGHANLLVDLVKALHMEKAVIVGWSLGGNILFEAADSLKQAPGFMTIGAPPVANPFDPNAFLPSPLAGLLFQADLTEDQIQGIVNSFFKPNTTNIPEVFFEDLRKQDPLARVFLGVTIGTGNFKDQLSVVRNLSVPLAVVAGTEEQLTNTAYQKSLEIPTLWHNKVWEIPNAGHMAQWENPVFFNVLLAAFAIETNSNQ